MRFPVTSCISGFSMCFTSQWAAPSLQAWSNQNRWGFNASTESSNQWLQGNIVRQGRHPGPGHQLLGVRTKCTLIPTYTMMFTEGTHMSGLDEKPWYTCYLLQLSLVSVVKCKCSLHYIENEEKSAGRWKSEGQTLLKKTWRNLIKGRWRGTVLGAC